MDENAVETEVMFGELVFPTSDDEARAKEGWARLLDRLRVAGVDVNRPMWVHFDNVSGTVFVRQLPWRG